MLPADQRLKARELSVLERYDGLVMNSQFVTINRPPQIVLHLQNIDGVRVHALIEHFITGLALRLRAIHRRVGIAQHVLGVIVAG